MPSQYGSALHFKKIPAWESLSGPMGKMETTSVELIRSRFSQPKYVTPKLFTIHGIAPRVPADSLLLVGGGSSSKQKQNTESG